MKNQLESNILWVDYAKFFGIFLMIFGHILHPNSYLYSFIYLFHMPLFFIISGFLYKKKTKTKNYEKIVFALLIPYFLYQFLYIPLSLIDYIILKDQPVLETLIKCFYGILQGATITNAPYNIVCGPCWFILVMVQLRSIFCLLKNDFKNMLFIFFLSIIASKILINNNILLYCCLNCTLIAIPYFIMGMIFRYFNVDFYNFSNKCFVLVYVIFAIFSLNIILHCNGLVKLSRPLEPFYNSNPALSLMYIGGILGSLMIMFLSTLFKREAFAVNLISKNTLFIIFAQEFIIFILRHFQILQIIYSEKCAFFKILSTFVLSAFVLYLCYIIILKFIFLNIFL